MLRIYRHFCQPKNLALFDSLYWHAEESRLRIYGHARECGVMRYVSNRIESNRIESNRIESLLLILLLPSVPQGGVVVLCHRTIPH